MTNLVYIDDFNSIEKLKISEAMSHITTRKKQVRVLAPKSEVIFKEITNLATEINMRVNKKKRNYYAYTLTKTVKYLATLGHLLERLILVNASRYLASLSVKNQMLMYT